MKVKYNISDADWLKYSEDHHKNSDKIRSIILWGKLIPSLLLIGLAVMPLIMTGRWRDDIYLFIALAVVWFFFWPKLFEIMLRKDLKRHLSQGNSDCPNGEVMLTLADDHLHAHGDCGDTEIKLDDIRKVVEGEDHYFVHTATIHGLLLPKDALDGDASDFVKNLKDKI